MRKLSVIDFKVVSKLQEPATPCFVPARLIYTLSGKPRDARQFGEVKTPRKRRKRRKTNAAFVLCVAQDSASNLPACLFSLVQMGHETAPHAERGAASIGKLSLAPAGRVD